MQGLPAEVLLRIFRFLDPDGLLKVGQTCKYLHQVTSGHLIWYQVLGLDFFHKLGLEKNQIDKIQDLRAWFIDYKKMEHEIMVSLDRFIASGDPQDASPISAHLGKAELILEDLPRKTFKHVFWADWFSRIVVKLEGLRTLYMKPKDTFDEPLDACISAKLASGHSMLRYNTLRVLDDPIWSTDAYFLKPTERIDLMIKRIDDAFGTSPVLLKSALFVELANRHGLVSATLVSVGRPGTAAYVCVFLGSTQCFIDFTRSNGVVRSTEDIKGRIDYMGASNNVRAGLNLEDILASEPDVFDVSRCENPTGPLTSQALPYLLKESYLNDDSPRHYRYFFSLLSGQVFDTQSYTQVGGLPVKGNYEDLRGRLCRVYFTTCVILEATEQSCLVLDGSHIMRAPPHLIEPARRVPVHQGLVYGFTLPAIDELHISTLGQYFERWDERLERFV